MTGLKTEKAIFQLMSCSKIIYAICTKSVPKFNRMIKLANNLKQHQHALTVSAEKQ